ncbi:hypothetical protein Gobs01_05045 [Geodermatophilus obscurus DSM 43160]
MPGHEGLVAEQQVTGRPRRDRHRRRLRGQLQHRALVGGRALPHLGDRDRRGQRGGRVGCVRCVGLLGRRQRQLTGLVGDDQDGAHDQDRGGEDRPAPVERGHGQEDEREDDERGDDVHQGEVGPDGEGEVAAHGHDRDRRQRPRADPVHREPLRQEEREDDGEREVEVLDQPDRPAEEPEVGRPEGKYPEHGGGDHHAGHRTVGAPPPVPPHPRQQREGEPEEVGRGQALDECATPVEDRGDVGGGARGGDVTQLGDEERVVGQHRDLLALGHRQRPHQRQEDEGRGGPHTGPGQHESHQPAVVPAREELDGDAGEHDDHPECCVRVAGRHAEGAEDERHDRQEVAAGLTVGRPPEPGHPGERHEPCRPAGRLVEQGEPHDGDAQGDDHRGHPAGPVLAEQEVSAHAQQGQELYLHDGGGRGQVVEQRDEHVVQQLDRVPQRIGRLGGVVAAAPAGGVHRGPLPAAQSLAEVVPQRDEGLGVVPAVVERVPLQERDRRHGGDREPDADDDHGLGNPVPAAVGGRRAGRPPRSGAHREASPPWCPGSVVIPRRSRSARARGAVTLPSESGSAP